jgi:predicted DNA-binding transcriptional regulator AlpA
LAITVARFAHLFSISATATYAAIERGEVPALRLGGRIVIPMAWVRQRITDAMQPKADGP